MSTKRVGQMIVEGLEKAGVARRYCMQASRFVVACRSRKRCRLFPRK